MRYWVLLLLLVSCSPHPPTGNVVATTSHPEDPEFSLLSVDVYDSFLSDLRPVRITIRGDKIYNLFYVDDKQYFFSVKDDVWLEDYFSRVVYLPEGFHTVKAYSCVKTFTGFSCGCVGSSCNNWLIQGFYVP